MKAFYKLTLLSYKLLIRIKNEKNMKNYTQDKASFKLIYSF